MGVSRKKNNELKKVSSPEISIPPSHPWYFSEVKQILHSITPTFLLICVNLIERGKPH